MAGKVERTQAVAAGVMFPRVDGERSTSAFGREVAATALAGVDPVGSAAAAREATWRSGYLPHFRRLVESGLAEPEDAVAIATAGVDAAIGAMTWAHAGEEIPLPELAAADASAARVAKVTGRARPVDELAVPVKGSLLRGDTLDRQLDRWAQDGVLEPSAAESVRTVAAHPEWLALPGHTMVALGAGSEIGPTPTFLRWGATVAGIDLRRPDIWARVLQNAEESAGTLFVPASGVSGPLADHAGFDLLSQLPEVAAWVADLSGPLVVGNYVYADGGTNVRASAAGDALVSMVRRTRDDVTLAFLATPTDVFAVPGEAVEQSVENYESRSRLTAMPGRGLRALSGGRLLRRAYRPGADPGLCDALVPQQGPNYALAKRMQRWRATAEAAAGRAVSMNVAPPTRTRSVVKNRALAAAYAGAHRFGVTVFEPSTTRVLMAALLVHDLYGDAPVVEHPWQAEAHQAVHGGLWRSAYDPRSALGLAALLGYGAGRS
jgi:hypothetical protein